MLLLSAILTLSSCNDSYEVKFENAVFCSDDLLNFVTPVVTYKENNGREVTIRFSDNGWNKTPPEGFNISTTSNSLKLNIDGLWWNNVVRYDDFNVSEYFTVSFERTPNVQIDDNKLYFFMGIILCNAVSIYHDRGLFKSGEDVYHLEGFNNPFISSGYQGSEQVERFINQICQETYKLGVHVDDDGNLSKTTGE